MPPAISYPVLSQRKDSCWIELPFIYSIALRFGSERRKAKILNFSIAYGKTAFGLAKDFNTSLEDAQNTVER